MSGKALVIVEDSFKGSHLRNMRGMYQHYKTYKLPTYTNIRIDQIINSQSIIIKIQYHSFFVTKQIWGSIKLWFQADQDLIFK